MVTNTPDHNPRSHKVSKYHLQDNPAGVVSSIASNRAKVDSSQRGREIETNVVVATTVASIASHRAEAGSSIEDKDSNNSSWLSDVEEEVGGEAKGDKSPSEAMGTPLQD